MIQTSLECIVKMLNQYMINRLGVDEDCVVLGRLANADGSVPAANSNKTVISFVSIEKDEFEPYYTNRMERTDGSGYVTKNVNEIYNIAVLVSANFDDYAESLKCLDNVIVFFGNNGRIDANNYPGMLQGITRITTELVNVDYEKTQQLWDAMGAKYLPSVLCRLRLQTDGRWADTAPMPVMMVTGE